MPRINLYGQNRHIIIVDGVPLSGFANGDYVQVKQDGNAAKRTEGGDGPTMNLSVEQGGMITIGLNPTSPIIGALYEIRNAQKAAPRMFSIILTTGVDELINCSGCAFADLPEFQTGGPEMQPRSFPFECLKIDMDLSAVESVAGGLIGGLI